MKIKFDIDCTPKEAREFLGLPDVAPMQERLIAQIEERLQKTLSSKDIEELWKLWMPFASPFGEKGGEQVFEQMRRFFWPGQGPRADDDKES